MMKAFDINTTEMYAFHFSTSDQVVHLTQQQLESIPYLFNLVNHKDDFSSVQNENGEYILNPPIHYNCFMSILHSITSEQPYVLFNELPEDENILDTFQLFIYLGIKSFPVPLLRDERLVHSNSINNNEKSHVEYHMGTLSEIRHTAAEFILALSTHEYNLRDSYTVKRIFSLIGIVLSNKPVFSSRFRHHTLTVVKKYCYSFFSKVQQRQVPTSQQITPNSQIDSLMYLYNDDNSLPENFQNTFVWRGVHMPIEDPLPTKRSFHDRSLKGTLLFRISQLLVFIPDSKNLPIYQTKQNEKNSEAQSARSGQFNTVPKRPTVDKFKCRFGPIAQKYR